MIIFDDEITIIFSQFLEGFVLLNDMSGCMLKHTSLYFDRICTTERHVWLLPKTRVYPDTASHQESHDHMDCEIN